MAETNKISELNTNLSPSLSHSGSNGNLCGRTVTPVLSGENLEESKKVSATTASVVHTNLSDAEGVSRKISELKVKLIADGVKIETAEKIASWYLKNWQLVVRNETDADQVPNTGIKSFKIYRDPVSSALVGQIGLRDLMHGSNKGLKKTENIIDGVQVEHGLRYKPVKHLPKAKKDFYHDINIEMYIREQLGEIPHLLDIQQVKYSGKLGLEVRYIPEECEGSVCDLIFDPKNKQELDPLDPSVRQTEKALRCCLDALKAIVAIHQKGYVHHDIKLENILFKQGRGLLCDLGFCCKASDPKKCSGTPGYVAPELFRSAPIKDLRKTDIFSLGVVLLTIIDPTKGVDLLAIQYDVIEGRTEGHEYLELHQQFIDALSKDDPLLQLIARTLDLDPSKRPTSEELLQQLTECLSKR